MGDAVFSWCLFVQRNVLAWKILRGTSLIMWDIYFRWGHYAVCRQVNLLVLFICFLENQNVIHSQQVLRGSEYSDFPYVCTEAIMLGLNVPFSTLLGIWLIQCHDFRLLLIFVSSDLGLQQYGARLEFQTRDWIWVTVVRALDPSHWTSGQWVTRALALQLWRKEFPQR